MKTLRALLSTLLITACGSPGINLDGGPDPHGGDAGQQTQGCLVDTDCGDGEVCVNCNGDGQCTPGCRTDSQCPARNICQVGTVCQTCPCAPGWCILNPCRDEDMDGYAATLDPTVKCSIPTGDCNDRDPTVHPGATELCTNYVDDNCDGLVDERDPTCVCPTGEQRCSDSWDCGGVGTTACEKGCCTACNNNTKPDCNFGGGAYCAQQYGVDPTTGCGYGWSCDACSGCPSTVAPVCAVNGSTYDNACLLGLRFTDELHDGACVPGEGMYCKGELGVDGGCGTSGDMYCRDTCGGATSCNVAVCTKKGACVMDSDCPAGLEVPPGTCDGGTFTFSCLNHACVTNCH
jgi:hypothetical protein